MNHKEELSFWIKKMHCKRKQVRYNYFKRAVLTHAVKQAEIKLRTKQISRINRCKKSKPNVLKDTCYGGCSKFNMEKKQELSEPCIPDKKRMEAMWLDKDIKDDINNLDKFLMLCNTNT